MNLQRLLAAGVFTISASFGANAQIINATTPDVPLWGAPNNTGLAVAPDEDIQVAVFDEPGTGTYHVQWLESTSGALLDDFQQNGTDPDVAYYSNADVLAIAYESGGDILVDEHYLNTLSPVNYTYGGTIGISNGEYPNIDIASTGLGVVTWEDGGDIFLCSYQIGFGAGPIVVAGSGTQPDAILTDGYDLGALTYIDQGGDLVIETFDLNDLFGGGYSTVNNWTYSPDQIYEFPRIASQRNANFGGNPENFTVVVQDYNVVPGSAEVDAFFMVAGNPMNGPVVVNPDFSNCYGDYPLPAVTYSTGRVHIIWSQEYYNNCTSL